LVLLTGAFLIYVTGSDGNFVNNARISLGWLQIFGLFPNFSENWPVALLYLLRTASVFNVDISLASPGIFVFYLIHLICTLECSVDVSYWTLFHVKMLFPFVVLGVTFLMYLTTTIYVGGSNLSIKSIRKFLRQLSIALFLLFYTYEVVTVAEPFSCVKQRNGDYLMYSAPHLKCFDQQWMDQFFYIMIYVTVYLVLIPLYGLYLFLINRNQKAIAKFNEKFGSLTLLYKPKHYYWELVHILKRLLFSSALNFFSIFFPSHIHRFLALCILFLFFLIEILVFPYNSIFGNQCNLLWTAIALLYFIASSVVVGSKVLTQGQKDFLSFFLISLLLYGLYYSFWDDIRGMWSRFRGKSKAEVEGVPTDSVPLGELYDRVRGSGGVWGEGLLRSWHAELIKR
jgi:hypothetical protein